MDCHSLGELGQREREPRKPPSAITHRFLFLSLHFAVSINRSAAAAPSLSRYTHVRAIQDGRRERERESLARLNLRWRGNAGGKECEKLAECGDTRPARGTSNAREHHRARPAVYHVNTNEIVTCTRADTRPRVPHLQLVHQVSAFTRRNPDLRFEGSSTRDAFLITRH